MNLKRALKITLLIVILAEEIKSATKQNLYKVSLDVDSSKILEKIEDITKQVNKVNTEEHLKEV
ncbi:hypothetical protein ACWEWU_10875 [Staphylococcus xylosus]